MSEERGQPTRSVRLTRSLVGARRDLTNGFGEALSTAVELAVTPAIFALLGWRLDLAIGTSPVFFVSFFLFVVSYVGWKQLHRYELEMREQEKLFKQRIGERR